ncbi:hypothetical protein NUW54_g1867 [Trametes sanguinea]|uniref:Uncharacterized protein n=2 Tax=Trametes sanguinea TaxID=158606 RepID=A0ACC1Q7S2_9APHY|nr:hypothetical protein NUW54_g3575 [Trametes sanguinea]KAJ3012443.1 hypothetical protein NUW54_g1867 [Trametes sanguinea]
MHFWYGFTVQDLHAKSFKRLTSTKLYVPDHIRLRSGGTSSCNLVPSVLWLSLRRITREGAFLTQLDSFRAFVSASRNVSARYRVLVALAVVLSVVTLAATVIACMAEQLERFVPDIWIDTASYASTVASDAITTGVLVFNLKRYRTGIERTDALLDRLASYSINTGTAAHRHREYAPTHPRECCLIRKGEAANCMTWLGPQSLFGKKVQVVFLALSIPSTKVYANSVLTALNSRNALVDASNAVSTHLEFTTLNQVANGDVEARMAIPVPATRVPQDDHSGRGLLSPVAGMEGEGRSFSDRLISGDL